MPSLFVIQGQDQGARYELGDEALTLGRDANNPIQLHDTEVSRRHAEIARNGTTYRLSDLASSNGTFVNGQQITQHDLASGDQVQVGRTLMLYTGGGDAAARELSERIEIDSHKSSGGSRIVRSMTQEEGSRFFELDFDSTESPWLARARSNLQIMYRTALAVSHTLDIDQLLSRIMQLIFEWVEADRGCIMLVDPQSRSLEPKVRTNRKGIRSDDTITISKTILDYVMEHNEGVMTSDAREDERWDTAASIVQMGVREAICVPMQGRYDVVGVIYIDTTISAQRVIQQGGARKFNDEHLKLMIAIAHQAALAVEDTRYYSAMVQAERLAAVGQTIATLSHHIKNVLQGIRGGSYLIEMGLTDHNEELTRKGWDIVDRNQNKISALVMDMLTFSKEREPDLAPADLNEVCAEVVELMQVRARDMESDLEWRPDPAMPTLVFDPEGLHRAVLNIVTNAIDACDRGPEPEGEAAAHRGRVQVSTEFRTAEGLARVVVEDNGVGIPADQIEAIFNLFVSHKGGRGTGLGLPVSQKILKEHGGRILVDSRPGEGSRFTLEFPATPPESVKLTSVNDVQANDSSTLSGHERR